MDLAEIASLSPMLAKAVDTVPEPDAIPGGYAYEPKWDGFRAIIAFDGDTVEIGSRGAKPLTRYFPELTGALPAMLPGPCVIDGEIVVRRGAPGGERLDWESLSARIHPAERRIAVLARETPAVIVAFDLLAVGSRSLLDEPFGARRSALEALAEGLGSPLFVSRSTTDVALARRWFVDFEGAGLDGVVAKPLGAVYSPGKRTMLKIKHHRTADVVLVGYRVHSSGAGVGSLLLGLYDDAGELQPVGGISAFTASRRLELIAELEPLVQRDATGDPITGERERTRFSGGKDRSFVQLEPSRVIQVRYDQMEGSRFRHTAQFDRWRPDRDARSCTFAQLERPLAYDLGTVLD